MSITTEDIKDYTERLLESSLKARITKRNTGYVAMYNKEIPDDWRKAEEIEGFMTKEQVASAFVKNDPATLLIVAGLAFISDGEAFFLSDDNGFGYDILPSSFVGCSITNLQHNVGPGKRYKTVDDIFKQYCRNERYLGSLEELANYVLTGE